LCHHNPVSEDSNALSVERHLHQSNAEKVAKMKKSGQSGRLSEINILKFDLLFVVGLVQHRHIVNMKSAIIQFPGNADVVSFMPLQGVLIINVDDAFVFFGNKHEFRSSFSALLGARRIVDVLGSAFLIAYPSAHFGGLGSFIFGHGQG
jgi:hypothetical protein